MHVSDNLVGLASVIMALAIPIIVVLAVAIRKIRVSQMLHEERMAAIEKGLPPPCSEDYVLAAQKTVPTVRDRESLRRGLLWGFVGLGLLVSAWAFTVSGIQHHREILLAGGIISVCAGAANLIFYFIESRKPDGPQS